MTIIEPRQTLQGRLRAARQFAGLEQAQLAELIGVARTTLSNWENGKSQIPGPSMIRWSEVTKISLDWIAWGNVRPEGFEPPTYCSVVCEIVCQCGHGDYSHDDKGDCSRCSCLAWFGKAAIDAAFWSIVAGVEAVAS